MSSRAIDDLRRIAGSLDGRLRKSILKAIEAAEEEVKGARLAALYEASDAAHDWSHIAEDAIMALIEQEE